MMRAGGQSYSENYLSNFGFKKLEQIQGIFEHEEADIIWSLDLDTLITNHNIKLELFVSHNPDLFICEDYNGYNAGSFIIKRSDWSDQFLETTLKYKERASIHCEQDAIVRYIGVHPEDLGREIKILTHPSINSYLYQNYPEIPLQPHSQGQWEKGDFVLHLPAIGMDKRLEILKTTKIIK